jgi:hypothetical protein
MRQAGRQAGVSGQSRLALLEMLKVLEQRAESFEARARAARDLMASLQRCQDLEVHVDGEIALPEERLALPATRSGRPMKRLGSAVNRNARSTRRSPIAPGSLPDRIVNVLTEVGAPMKIGDLVEQVKAPHWDVKKQLGVLLRDKLVTRLGWARGALWATPQTAKVTETKR